MSSPKKALIVGSGYVGSHLHALLQKMGWEVWSLRRTKEDSNNHFSIDVTSPFSLNSSFDTVFYMVSADAYTPKAYENAFMLATSAKFFVGEEIALSNNWLNAIKLNDEYLTTRNEVLDGLNKIGFGCRPVWNLLCDLPHFVDCPAMELHTARNLQSRLINIPSSAVFGESLQLNA